ncbi:MAG: di-heme enzyme [Thermoanaerobaculia bacterium]|nr:di-heme enzyme [Thermoanaerobaculia bacterium]
MALGAALRRRDAAGGEPELRPERSRRATGRRAGLDPLRPLAWAAVLLTAALAGGCAAAGPAPSPPAGVLRGDPAPEGAPPGDAYPWRLPAGFPEPAVPPDNPMTAAKVELGRRLFYDRRLSGNGTLSCAACHRQEAAFTDGRVVAVGSTGERLLRNAMSLANVAYNAAFDWANPEVASLEEQMARPLTGTHPVEMGVAGREREIEERLAADPLYAELFRRAFPGRSRPVSLRGVVQAIASFERTLISGGSPYDRWVFHDDRSALGEAARRGMGLFFSERLGCGVCHGGLLLAGPIRFAGSPEPEVSYHNTGLYNVDGRGGYPEGNRGLYEKTGDPANMGRFRAPSLRNVALTAPYMHDGSIATLGEVIDHYAAGGRAEPPSPLTSPGVRGFELAPGERSDLVAFLESLTDPGFVTEERFSDPFSQKLTATPSE